MIHRVPRYRSRLPRCCATRWSPRWRPWCCAGGPRELRYATLPAADRVDRVDLDGRLVRISVRTLQRWRAAWASGKLAALEPRQRTRTTTSQALSVELVAFLRTEKRCDPRASAPELVRRARERGIVPVDQKIDRTSVWRACRRLGLPTRQRPHKREGDTRRWQYAERMQCVLADGKHFRAGAARRRRVALFFLDDATRYGLQVRVGTAESSELFLRALYQMVMRHGLADLFFLEPLAKSRGSDN